MLRDEILSDKILGEQPVHAKEWFKEVCWISGGIRHMHLTCNDDDTWHFVISTPGQ